MSNLSPRPGRSPSGRRKAESRAFALVMVGGTAGAVAAVTLILAIFGVGSLGLPVIALLIAVVCLLLFRSAVGKR